MTNDVKMTTPVSTTNSIIEVHKEYVSRDDLRAMAIGQKIMFVIPDDKMESARATCNNMRYYRMKFSCQLKVCDNKSVAIIERLA